MSNNFFSFHIFEFFARLYPTVPQFLESAIRPALRLFVVEGEQTPRGPKITLDMEHVEVGPMRTLTTPFRLTFQFVDVHPNYGATFAHPEGNTIVAALGEVNDKAPNWIWSDIHDADGRRHIVCRVKASVGTLLYFALVKLYLNTNPLTVFQIQSVPGEGLLNRLRDEMYHLFFTLSHKPQRYMLLLEGLFAEHGEDRLAGIFYSYRPQEDSLRYLSEPCFRYTDGIFQFGIPGETPYFTTQVCHKDDERKFQGIAKTLELYTREGSVAEVCTQLHSFSGARLVRSFYQPFTLRGRQVPLNVLGTIIPADLFSHMKPNAQQDTMKEEAMLGTSTAPEMLTDKAKFDHLVLRMKQQEVLRFITVLSGPLMIYAFPGSTEQQINELAAAFVERCKERITEWDWTGELFWSNFGKFIRLYEAFVNGQEGGVTVTHRLNKQYEANYEGFVEFGFDMVRYGVEFFTLPGKPLPKLQVRNQEQAGKYLETGLQKADTMEKVETMWNEIATGASLHSMKLANPLTTQSLHEMLREMLNR